jgi:3'(2'),5'-bisphosphate nucleotidase
VNAAQAARWYSCGVEYARELEVAQEAARAASAVILGYYRRDGVRVEIKPDGSPVTEADLDANRTILAIIRAAFPDDGILSEELPDSDERFGKRRVWIIDPLDGTRDFIARTDQFCSHVGFAVDGVATLGVVAQPVAGALFSAWAGGGAYLVSAAATGAGGAPVPARLRSSTTTSPAEMRVGVGRLNPGGRLGACLTATGLDQRVVALGASVKYLAIARGELDLAVNFSPGEMEWDTCAPEIIVREAGGALTDGDGRAFRYNQPDPAHRRGSIASNGADHARLVALLAPYFAADTV